MCNCGNKRTEYSTTSSAIKERDQNEKPTTTDASTVMEYVGKTALTAIGSITQTRYRFNFTGDKHSIDNRDVPSMIQIPVLRRVK
ncbi:hypothetical protein QEG73_05110 [Chitinophagaceae bacterium 26-R-25]|nr:hypothetical protein [Chitinophagaceae bacterium 26-R-25]